MKPDFEKIANDWMAYARLGPDMASEQVFVDGWELVELAQENPEAAWEAIRAIIVRYPEQDYYSQEKTEAQTVVGLMAAGPLEDIFMYHGAKFLRRAEIEARQDRRMAWALGGVWKSGMPKDVWNRVQRAADYSYWERPSVK